jgi:serine/threonine protein kinase
LRDVIETNSSAKPDEPIDQSLLLPRGTRDRAHHAASIIKALADAVAHAHKRGVYHRDLKPENVQLTSGGHPRIIDFGLCSNADTHSLSNDGQVLGTAAYLPPRSITAPTGVERDLWSLGVMLYEIATLERPFKGYTLKELEAKTSSGVFALPSARDADYPEDLELIHAKCMAADPRDRYASAMELSEDLELFLSGAAVKAGQRSLLKKLQAKLRRSKPAP